MSTQDSVDAYAIGCGVLATIEQWYPTRKFNGTMVPRKTIKYPTSAMCTVWVGVCVCVCVGGGGYPCIPASTPDPYLCSDTLLVVLCAAVTHQQESYKISIIIDINKPFDCVTGK